MSRATSFLAVLGPTAAGKSGLALALAAQLDGEIVACDSQQVYVGMDIGTAKPTRAERAQVPHHALDLVRPHESFHAARWAAIARAAILDVAARGRLPIVVGGTGLYYRALVAGLFDAPPPDAAIRARHRALAAAAGGLEALRARLAVVDPDAAAVIGPRDFVRTSRALEIYEQTGVAITTLRTRTAPPCDLVATALLIDPPLEILGERISTRVAEMMAAGFLEEVRALRAAGYGPALRPLQALGYRQLGEVLDGITTLETAVAETVRATFAYARRQRTWFRKEAFAQRFEAVPTVDAAIATMRAPARDLGASLG